MVQKVTVIHDSLGSLTGRRVRSNIIQFRSIPYATIPARFRQSQLVTELSDDERDFTEYGYGCPSRHQNDDFSGGPLPDSTSRKYDEFKCLNLTVSTPLEVMVDGGTQLRKLPVLVHVHGGGFIEGAGAISDSRDPSNMAEIGLQTGRPVVTVNINYRLNYQGFLACQDLVEEAKGTGEPSTNFGLYDQRNAFFWIRNFISGFGGDPENVTAFGESAGSGSLCLHMCSTVPLFQRAILMSGAPAGLPPVTMEKKEEDYVELLKFCDIDLNSTGKLDALRKVPVEKLVELAAPKGMMSLLQDPVFWPEPLRGTTTSAIMAKCSWVDEIIMCESFFEGFFFADAYKNVKIGDYISIVEHNLSAENASKILSSYGISSNMDKNLFWSRLMMLGGDLLLSEPMHELSEYLSQPSLNKKIYRYTNAMRNPFPGSTSYQVCGHAIDMLYCFGNYLDRYPTDRGRELSLGFIDRFTKFAYGQEPWEQYIPGERKIAVADGRVGWVTRTREEDEKISKNDEMGERRYAKWEIILEVFANMSPQDADKARWNIMTCAPVANTPGYRLQGTFGV